MLEHGDDSQAPQVHLAQVPPPVQTATPGRVDAYQRDTGRVEPLNPSALTVEQVAQLLTAAGAKRADIETIRRHIASGAPVSADGKVNLMHYLAWLMREVSNGEE
jgi:hypothetical protein